MNDIRLVFPNEEMENAVLDFKKEFFDNGEDMIPGSYKLDNDKYSYSEWLQVIRNNLDKDKYNPKFGLSHTLLAINADDRVIGIINLRHTITDFYKDSGHIGYSVRPTERKKGYATLMLSGIIDIAKELNLTELLLVCKRNNEPSRKIIIRCMGILNRVFEKNMCDYEEYKIIL